MKVHYYIYALIAGAMLALSACTPDKYEWGKQTYVADDLVEGIAYTVTVDGNRVQLRSKITGCTPLWETPQGRSQADELTIELPFAGTYEVTFGAETPAGVVFGEPYTFTLSQNDFSLLEDEKWFLLADENFKEGDPLPDNETLIAGISKRWYPCDADYGLGCTGPVMYMTPYDPDNDGAGYTAEDEENLVYKDITFGRENWAPNWDPGYQDWLIAKEDPYMDSYMTFSMDATRGCVATMYRGESGVKGASSGTNMTGKFNLNLTDATKPTISFTDCYAMHNVGFDVVCSNYTQDIQIAELTPYYLVLVTKRTNSEGNWYIVWNFVSEEVINTNGACIPKEDSGLIEKVAPVLPTFENLATDLFTTQISGVTYVGNQMTFNLDTEAPYDWLWWNASPDVQNWESVTGGSYNDSWAPVAGNDAEDFELILSKASDGTYNYECSNGTDGKVTFGDNTVTFDQEITLLTASSDMRTVAVKGTTFTVLEVEAGETLVLGVPESVNEEGEVNSYLVARLVYKKVAAGAEGPVVVPLNNNYSDDGITWLENDCVRLAFYHFGGKGIFKDPGSVKLKKNQTIKVTFKLKEGVITWSQTPKCALIDNNIKTAWEPQGCFDLDDAVLVNTTGETTVTLTNTTGATQGFIDCCLDLSIQFTGYGEGDYTDMFESVSCVIE